MSALLLLYLAVVSLGCGEPPQELPPPAPVKSKLDVAVEKAKDAAARGDTTTLLGIHAENPHSASVQFPHPLDPLLLSAAATASAAGDYKTLVEVGAALRTAHPEIEQGRYTTAWFDAKDPTLWRTLIEQTTIHDGPALAKAQYDAALREASTTPSGFVKMLSVRTNEHAPDTLTKDADQWLCAHKEAVTCNDYKATKANGGGSDEDVLKRIDEWCLVASQLVGVCGASFDKKLVRMQANGESVDWLRRSTKYARDEREESARILEECRPADANCAYYLDIDESACRRVRVLAAEKTNVPGGCQLTLEARTSFEQLVLSYDCYKGDVKGWDSKVIRDDVGQGDKVNEDILCEVGSDEVKIRGGR